MFKIFLSVLVLAFMFSACENASSFDNPVNPTETQKTEKPMGEMYFAQLHSTYVVNTRTFKIQFTVNATEFKDASNILITIRYNGGFSSSWIIPKPDSNVFSRDCIAPLEIADAQVLGHL